MPIYYDFLTMLENKRYNELLELREHQQHARVHPKSETPIVFFGANEIEELRQLASKIWLHITKRPPIYYECLTDKESERLYELQTMRSDSTRFFSQEQEEELALLTHKVHEYVVGKMKDTTNG